MSKEIEVSKKMDEEQLENKIAFQIGFLIYSNKIVGDVIRDLKRIALEYSEQFKSDYSESGSVFPSEFLEKNTTQPFEYIIGVSTCDKKEMVFCLSRKNEKGIEILLSKVSQDETSFKNEVKLLSELFKAKIVRTH